VAAAAACFAVIGLAAACSSSSSGGSNSDSASSASSAASSGSSGSGSAPASGGAGEAVTQADAQLAVAEKGRFTSPPSTSSPAFKGGNIWVIEASATTPSITIPAQAAKAAATSLGWKTTIYDAKGLPSNYTQGVSNAIANGANGIILISIDCSYVKNQLEQAKEKKIAVSEVYSFDCSETNPGQPSLFSADLSFGTRWKNLEVAWQQWGSDTAAYVIKGQQGKANALLLDTKQVAVEVSYEQGFKDRLKQCSTCSLVDQPWDVINQATPAAIASLIQSAVLKNPKVNSSVYGSTVTSGYNQGILALGSKVKDMTIVGGLGLQDEFNLIKDDKGLNATTAWPQQWIGYAAVDSINSVLAGRKTDDEGIGWQIVDKETLPTIHLTNGIWNGVDNYAALYNKRWGVS
jgi:ribose transport system substrate-binding protein